MVCETVNNIIGRTVNPRGKHWSCGGSSGGEGAIVAFRGGIIGVGTDIGEFMQSDDRKSLTHILQVDPSEFHQLSISSMV